MIRMFRLIFLRILIIFGVSVFTSLANARYLTAKPFFVTGLVTQLNDVGSTSSTAASQAFVKQINQVEIGARAMNIFCLSLIGQQASESTSQSLKGYGAGIRVDLPGFFLIGSDEADFRRKSKAYPVNSSIFMQSISTQYTQGTSITKTIANRYGFSVELFPFQTLMYLSLEAGLYNFQGNSFANYGFGLGMQF
jgi:hypothetical protein